MKNYFLVAALLMHFLTNLFGEVKNGYEKNVPALMISLQGLQTILHCHPDLSRAQRRSIKRKIKLVIRHITYHAITERLLQQFKLIAPDLYSEIDTLRDAGGNVIDVYVEYIARGDLPFRTPGISSLTQAPDNVNSCNSEYGEGSASVIVSVLHTGLRVLAHEFGHLKYVIPNMKSYAAFFRKRYKSGSMDFVFGHDLRDPSGTSAFLFERRFRRRHRQYLKQESTSFRSYIAEFKAIERNVLEALK